MVYLNGLGNGFVWDDEYTVVRNEAIRELSNVPRFFVDPGTGSSNPNQVFYRPLRTLVYSLVHAAWGLEPLPYHAINVALHGGNVLLVFFIFSSLARSNGAGAAVAALFAVHPLSTEAVSNVTGLTDVLFAFLYLLALKLHLRRAIGDRHRMTWAAVVVSLCVLSLLAKEMALSLPLMILLIDWASRSASRRPSYIAYITSLVLACVAFVGLRSWLLGTVGQGGEYAGGTFLRTMLMQAKVVGKYLQLIFFPVGQSARHTTSIPVSISEPGVVGSLVVLGALLGLAVWGWRRDRWVTFGVGWFLIALLPVMNFLPIRGDLMGERFCYLPMVGMIFLSVHAASRLLAERHAAVGTSLLLVTLGALAVLTIQRNRTWRSNLALFEDAVRISPRSNAVRLNLVKEYERLGRAEDARREYLAAAENTRHYFELYRNLGDQELARGDLREARIWYERALRMNERDSHSRQRLQEIEAGELR